MIDLKSLILLTGLGNLLFAVLLALYVSADSLQSKAFRYWQRAKILIALASILTSLRPWLPLPLALHVAHTAYFASWTLELMAYCFFLGRVRYIQSLPWISGVLVAVHLLLLSLPVSRTVSLISFSLIGCCLEFGMALVLLSNNRFGKPLTRMLAVISLISSGLFLMRAAFGLTQGGFSAEELQSFNMILFLLAFLHLIGNSFGFLLLTKQEDEHRLKHALNSVSNAEKEQRQLLSMASHEFRTPAAMIQTSLDSLALLRIDIPPEVRKRLNNINLATQRMINLANHLISQDRFQELALAPTFERCEFGQLISDIVGCYDLEAKVTFEPPSEMIMVDADPTLIGIALNNLLDNAVRYSKTADGDYQLVEVSLQALAGRIELMVHDQGPGIADADKEKVFQRFYNLRRSPHSGIGLSIVRTIALAHHGMVSAADRQPHGTTMCLTLPRP